MATVIPALLYREHCIKQGRDGIKPLTRKQKKALRQHTEARNEKDAYRAREFEIECLEEMNA